MIQIIQRWLYKANLPALIKKQLQSGLHDVFREIERWSKAFFVLLLLLHCLFRNN